MQHSWIDPPPFSDLFLCKQQNPPLNSVKLTFGLGGGHGLQQCSGAYLTLDDIAVRYLAAFTRVKLVVVGPKSSQSPVMLKLSRSAPLSCPCRHHGLHRLLLLLGPHCHLSLQAALSQHEEEDCTTNPGEWSISAHYAATPRDDPAGEGQASNAGCQGMVIFLGTHIRYLWPYGLSRPVLLGRRCLSKTIIRYKCPLTLIYIATYLYCFSPLLLQCMLKCGGYCNWHITRFAMQYVGTLSVKHQ